MVYTMLTETPPSFYNMPQPVGGVLSRPYIPPFTVCQREALKFHPLSSQRFSLNDLHTGLHYNFSRYQTKTLCDVSGFDTRTASSVNYRPYETNTSNARQMNYERRKQKRQSGKLCRNQYKSNSPTFISTSLETASALTRTPPLVNQRYDSSTRSGARENLSKRQSSKRNNKKGNYKRNTNNKNCETKKKTNQEWTHQRALHVYNAFLCRIEKDFEARENDTNKNEPHGYSAGFSPLVTSTPVRHKKPPDCPSPNHVTCNYDAQQNEGLRKDFRKPSALFPSFCADKNNRNHQCEELTSMNNVPFNSRENCKKGSRIHKQHLTNHARNQQKCTLTMDRKNPPKSLPRRRFSEKCPVKTSKVVPGSIWGCRNTCEENCKKEQIWRPWC